MTTLLIDADIVAFQAAAATEVATKWDDDLWTLHAYESEGQTLIKKKLAAMLEQTGCEDFKLYLTGKKNFRYDVLPSYKGNRKDTRKPMTLGPLKQWMIDEYQAVLREPFEADDLLGIRGSDGNDTIIASEDKDLRTIPCRFFNPAHPEDGVTTISEADADLFFFTQVLTGDAVDNYKGCPKIGPVKAQQILHKASLQFNDLTLRNAAMWGAIAATFQKAGLTEEDAITQARCARILRFEDIADDGSIILWKPPLNIGAD
jgi:DNA polymerase-1|tara:strand:+ start:72 stop:851 length:780 start_codon:yes stop_codon:yes gene_type:complete